MFVQLVDVDVCLAVDANFPATEIEGHRLVLASSFMLTRASDDARQLVTVTATWCTCKFT